MKREGERGERRRRLKFRVKVTMELLVVIGIALWHHSHRLRCQSSVVIATPGLTRASSGLQGEEATSEHCTTGQCDTLTTTNFPEWTSSY